MKTAHVLIENLGIEILVCNFSYYGKLTSYYLKTFDFQNMAYCLNLFLEKLRLYCQFWKITLGMFLSIHPRLSFQIRFILNIKNNI